MGAGQRSITLPASVQAHVTVRVPLLQTLAFGTGAAAAEMLGGVLSMFTLADTLAENPARLIAAPVTTWLAPSALSVAGAVQEAIPNIGSEQVKLTVTFELFQPAAFGA